MWLATEDGLDRYDGYTLRRFAHERSDRSGLAGNWIWTIREDRSGDLWFAVKNSGVAGLNENPRIRHRLVRLMDTCRRELETSISAVIRQLTQSRHLDMGAHTVATAFG